MMSDESAPPLPVLSGTTSAPAAVSTRNEWGLLVQSVPLHFTPPMYQTLLVTTKQVPAVPASPFRTGELRFNADGIVIEGMAVLMPPKWYVGATMLAALPYFLMQFAFRFIRSLGLPRPLRLWVTLAVIFGTMSLAFVPWFLQKWLNKRRTETKTVLDWESLRAVQVDTKLRSVTLVYSTFNVPQKIKAIPWLGVKAASLEASNWHYITLGKLEPPIVQGVADTLAHFAPHAVHERVDARRNVLWSSPVLRVFFVLLLVVMFAIIGFAFYASYKRRNP
ncbi:MAG: hypothetical protein H7Y38_12565 [Armatimonadetes bacterium]|nr:hypothetical protein [Armatimonadota bacterium]